MKVLGNLSVSGLKGEMAERKKACRDACGVAAH